jgi:hypothetical protein
MPSTDTKPELTAKASMAQPVSHPAVYANVLKEVVGAKRVNFPKKWCFFSTYNKLSLTSPTIIHF